MLPVVDGHMLHRLGELERHRKIELQSSSLAHGHARETCAGHLLEEAKYSVVPRCGYFTDLEVSRGSERLHLEQPGFDRSLPAEQAVRKRPAQDVQRIIRTGGLGEIYGRYQSLDVVRD